MKVTFLGTGTSQGVPVIGCTCEVCRSMDFRDKRLRTSLMVEVQGVNLVIDTGPDFRVQMLRERVDKLDAVLYTHEHKDHTAGMDDIRSFNFLQKSPIPIYARDQVIDQLKKEFSYVFADLRYPGVPQVEINKIRNEKFKIQGIEITPINVFHYKLPVFGFRIQDMVYITDANSIPEKEWKKLLNCRILIINALQHHDHISHFNVSEAIQVAQKVKADQTYFTHISHKLGKHKMESEKLPENIHLAFDGLQIEL